MTSLHFTLFVGAFIWRKIGSSRIYQTGCSTACGKVKEGLLKEGPLPLRSQKGQLTTSQACVHLYVLYYTTQKYELLVIM